VNNDCHKFFGPHNPEESAMGPPPSPASSRPSWAVAPVIVPLATALLGLIGGALVGTLKSRADLALEDKRLQSQLILQATQSGEPSRPQPTDCTRQAICAAALP
jgi:hypothetical protein